MIGALYSPLRELQQPKDFCICVVVIFSILISVEVGSFNWVNCNSLLIVEDDVRCRFGHFKMGTDLLDLRCLLFQSYSNGLNFVFLLCSTHFLLCNARL